MPNENSVSTRNIDKVKSRGNWNVFSKGVSCGFLAIVFVHNRKEKVSFYHLLSRGACAHPRPRRGPRKRGSLAFLAVRAFFCRVYLLLWLKQQGKPTLQSRHRRTQTPSSALTALHAGTVGAFRKGFLPPHLHAPAHLCAACSTALQAQEKSCTAHPSRCSKSVLCNGLEQQEGWRQRNCRNQDPAAPPESAGNEGSTRTLFASWAGALAGLLRMLTLWSSRPLRRLFGTGLATPLPSRSAKGSGCSRCWSCWLSSGHVTMVLGAPFRPRHFVKAVKRSSQQGFKEFARNHCLWELVPFSHMW